jgi:hypothetical protein
MNSIGPQPSLPMVPNAPSPPPLFGAQQQPGQKPKRQSFFPTFLGSGATPDASQVGQKTLLGGGAT